MNQNVSRYPNDHTTELQEAEDPEVAGRGWLRALPGQGSPELGAELSPTQDIRARVEGDSPGTLGWAVRQPHGRATSQVQQLQVAPAGAGFPLNP